MRGYEKDEYENWDEYEEDGEEQEEEEGGDYDYKEVHQPTQEELDYLAIRQKLKESIRKKMKKDAGTANPTSRYKVNASRKDNYGSFFGPSQPVIAQRVIQESKSLLENPDLAARMCKTSQKEKKTYVSAPVSSKFQALPNVKNGLKKKVEMLKNTRDYSFLLSEDAEVPASLKGPPPRNASAPKSDAQSAELMQRSRLVVNGRVREVSSGCDGRKPMLPCSQSKSKVGMDKLTLANKSSAESRKQFGNKSGSGPGRPLGPKVVPSKSSVPVTAKSTQPVTKNIISGVRKPTSSPLQPGARRPVPSNLHSGNNRPTSSHGQPSALRRPVQKKDYHGTTKPKVISKQSLPSSKVQTKISPQRHPPRVPSRDERPKAKLKRQLRDEDSEGADAINLIRQMFGYNPNRFRDDDDTGNMEANFDDIMREEKRSSRIANQEDEEQRLLNEEEERRERMRQAKKRKMSH
ncbi:protein SPT2 isoform X2 [Salvia divinorum]|uniref:Protein SPT2 isoform X2 n=1 Tax=Salvia divinorum TaxID=28513 RepID=A0ABD1HVH2_SALDI